MFRIVLPVTEPERGGPRALEQRGPAIPPRSILVVEDEPEVAEALADLLTFEGHHVETAANGAVALDKLATRAYDVIMSDVRMPALDGPGLYRALAQRSPDLCRRLVFVTGDELSPETREFLQQVRARTVVKPFELEQIRRAIEHTAGAGSDDRPRR